MTRIEAVGLCAVAAILTWGTRAVAQAPSIAVVELPAPSVTSRDKFGTILGVRELPGGGVLVDDAARKQLKRLSPTLAVEAIVKDTVRGAADFYGIGNLSAYFNPDPLKTIDEWTVTSDGTVAILRGHDYRVDWIKMDGTRSSSAKLPFDWRQLTDADKTKMIDSAETLRRVSARSNTLVNGIEKMVPWAGTGRGGQAARGTSLYPALDTTGALISKNNGGGDMTVFKNSRPSIEYVFDYYPPIRSGSIFADFDGNVWVLPTTSKESKAGELVYDVITPNGELTRRVRVPLGRYIVGLGRRGVVYMATGTSAGGFNLERTALR